MTGKKDDWADAIVDRLWPGDGEASRPLCAEQLREARALGRSETEARLAGIDAEILESVWKNAVIAAGAVVAAAGHADLADTVRGLSPASPEPSDDK